MTADNHILAKADRLTAFWDAAKNRVTVAIFDRARTQMLDAWSWDEEPWLTDVLELADRWSHAFGELTAPELRLILETACAVEAHMEHAASDLRRYGSVGVSY